MVKMKRWIYAGFVLLSVAVLTFVVIMTISVGNNNRKLLEDSIKSQLIAVCVTALTHINVEEFAEYSLDSYSVQEEDSYVQQVVKLSRIKDEVGATFIYAIKQNVPENNYFIVLDTDTVDNASFQVYEISDVHKAAFNGKISAGTMNVSDEYGDFNTGAAPIKHNGLVIGVICVDIADTLVSKSITDFRTNVILLITVLVALFVLAALTLYRFMSRVSRIQEELDYMANFDKLTELPNRRYLFKYLDDHFGSKKNTPLALFFIDIDNFKKVNDNAGHDEGDAFLVKLGAYFESLGSNSKVFRPGAGKINITARVGGDEFIIVTPGISSENEANEFAKEILDGFKCEEFEKYATKYDVGLSIGISLYQKHSKNYHILIKYADIAMYKAKQDGKNCFRLYNEGMTIDFNHNNT